MKILYIDVQNVLGRVWGYWREIDRAKFYDYVTVRYEIDKVYYAVWYLPHLQWEYDIMMSCWYELLLKETIINNGKTKWNVDIDIAIRSIFDLTDATLTEAYLMTNDGDYNTLIKTFQEYRVWGRLIAPDIRTASKALTRIVQDPIDLQYLRKLVEKQKSLH